MSHHVLISIYQSFLSKLTAELIFARSCPTLNLTETVVMNTRVSLTEWITDEEDATRPYS